MDKGYLACVFKEAGEVATRDPDSSIFFALFLSIDGSPRERRVARESHVMSIAGVKAPHTISFFYSLCSF